MASQAQESVPEHATDQTGSAAKRRRIALACNACRTRKTKCNGERPSCSTCLALNFDCQYEPTDSSTNVIVRKEYMSDLGQRVLLLESVVQRLDDTLRGHLAGCIDLPRVCPAAASHSTSLPLSHAPVESSFSRASRLEEPQDEAASTDGMAMIFVEERTSTFFGESSNISFIRLLLRAMAAVRRPALGVPGTLNTEYTVVENNMASFSQAWSNPSALPESRASSIMDLPSTDQIDGMLDTYFNTTGALFPFIHEVTFRETYTECRRNGFTKVRRTWLGTLNMMFALASSYDKDGTATARDRFEKSNVFYQRATSLCGDSSRRVVNLEIVHYLLLVVLYCQGTQRSVQAWNMHGFLVRSAMALGIHVDRSRDNSGSYLEESRRRTWLTIYCLDKVLSMTFGRPAAISDEHMNDSDLTGEFLGLSFRLYQVMGRSLIRQYGANMGREDLELDDMASLQASGEFRKALRVWASNLPSHLRLCEPQSDELVVSSKTHRLRVTLTLRYHNVSILVHRPLLTATIRHLFEGDTPSGGSSAYLVQLAMAEAQECIHSAESTIDIVASILAADRTSNNNLGIWFFTLYYVFTASLVICGRLLWARHGQTVADDAPATHAKGLLEKVQRIFERLDIDNGLVSSCAEYICHLSEMQNLQAPDLDADQPPAYPSTTPNAAQTQHQATAIASSLGMVGADMEDSQPFQLLASDIFDPSIFEGFEPSSDQTMLKDTPWHTITSRG